MRRVAALALLMLCVVAAYLFVDGREEGPQPVAALASQAEAPPQIAYRFEGVEVVQTGADGSRWEIEAREASVDDVGDMGALRDVRGRFAGESGEVAVVAGAGRIAPGPLVELHDGVEIRWDDFVVLTDAARYHHGERTVRSDVPVEVRSEGMVVRGGNLEVDIQQKTARMAGDVYAVIGGQPR